VNFGPLGGEWRAVRHPSLLHVTSPVAERETARRCKTLKIQRKCKAGAPAGMAFDAELARRLLESAAWTGEYRRDRGHQRDRSDLIEGST